MTPAYRRQPIAEVTPEVPSASSGGASCHENPPSDSFPPGSDGEQLTRYPRGDGFFFEWPARTLPKHAGLVRHGGGFLAPPNLMGLRLSNRRLEVKRDRAFHLCGVQRLFAALTSLRDRPKPSHHGVRKMIRPNLRCILMIFLSPDKRRRELISFTSAKDVSAAKRNFAICRCLLAHPAPCLTRRQA